MAFGRTSLNSPAVGSSRATGAGGQRPMSDINVTPLVDVMLVLLVIFIITAPLMTGAIRLDLPKAEAAAGGTAGPGVVALSLDREGRAFLDDRPVTPEALAAALADAARRHPDTELQLRADEAVPYGRVAELMGVAHRAGIGRIGFVTQPPAAPR
ncbi:MAG: biopolymer transporter ExbD [Variovorax sp.]